MKCDIPFNLMHNSWACSECGAEVIGKPETTGEFEPDGKPIIALIPISNYWNVERNEVYCSAEHGLLSHTNHKQTRHHP